MAGAGAGDGAEIRDKGGAGARAENKYSSFGSATLQKRMKGRENIQNQDDGQTG